MPKNPQKLRCEVPGCRAWAKRGRALCASHLGSRAVRDHADLVLPLLHAVSRQPTDGPLGNLEVIDEELRNLFTARTLFVSWIHKLSEEKDSPGVPPAQFMRAWNDSSTRVIQLLRARRDLGGKEGDFAPLMDSVYADLQTMFPALGAGEER